MTMVLGSGAGREGGSCRGWFWGIGLQAHNYRVGQGFVLGGGGGGGGGGGHLPSLLSPQTNLVSPLD